MKKILLSTLCYTLLGCAFLPSAKSISLEHAKTYSLPVEEADALRTGRLYLVQSSSSPIVDEITILPSYHYARLINLSQWIWWNEFPVFQESLQYWLKKLKIPFRKLTQLPPLAKKFSYCAPSLSLHATTPEELSYEFPYHYVFCTNDAYEFGIEENLLGFQNFPIIFVPKKDVHLYVRNPFLPSEDSLWTDMPH